MMGGERSRHCTGVRASARRADSVGRLCVRGRHRRVPIERIALSMLGGYAMIRSGQLDDTAGTECPLAVIDAHTHMFTPGWIVSLKAKGGIYSLKTRTDGRK